MKAQVISTDFVLTFILFLLALSIFFHMLSETTQSRSSIDVSRELIMDRFENNPRSFLHRSTIYLEEWDNFVEENNYGPAYEILFKDLESNMDMDYCVYIERYSVGGIEIIRNFAAGDPSDFPITMARYSDENILCGEEPILIIENKEPECAHDRSLVISRPVLVDNEIMNLKILVCSK